MAGQTYRSSNPHGDKIFSLFQSVKPEDWAYTTSNLGGVTGVSSPRVTRPICDIISDLNLLSRLEMSGAITPSPHTPLSHVHRGLISFDSKPSDKTKFISPLYDSYFLNL
jgi:hypothetical protein